MKKGLIMLCMFAALSQTAKAQIEMFDESVIKIEEPKAEPYDSLSNMQTKKYGNAEKYNYTFDHLIGQTLLYCGDPYSFLTNGRLKNGFYYKVTGTLPDDVGRGLYCRISLEDTQTGEIAEDGDLSSNRLNTRWVVVGHYEKIKALYLNKEYVYVGTDEVFIDYSWEKANGLISMQADTVTTNIPKESVWTCVGVQVKPRKKDDRMDIDYRSPIILVFDNPTYGKHYCYLEASDGKAYKSLLNDHQPLVCGRFQLKSYYDMVKTQTATNLAKRKADLTKRFGAENTKLILEGKVKLGMTKEMCRESWGNPYDINRSVGSWGTHEQWVYGDSYLYFEGNTLTSIQN